MNKCNALRRMALCPLALALVPACGNLDGGRASQPNATLTATETQRLMDAGARSVLDFTRRHFAQLDATGIGLLYGVRSSYASLSASAKREWVNARKRAGTNPALPESTSCIGWAYRHLRVAYVGAGREARWNEIESYVRSHDSDGLFLMEKLREDGWQVLYWNPDTALPANGDSEHTSTYRAAKTRGTYYNVKVDGFLINYRPTAGSGTVRDVRMLDALKKVKLWAGVANGAYHVFLGHGGNVNESHSPLLPTNRDNVEDSPFETWGLSSSVKYLSGVVAVPPGTLTRAARPVGSIACPSGFTLHDVGNQGGRFCADAEGNVLGPFTEKMRAKCRGWGGGMACEVDRWSKAMALAARGDALCPDGASLDPETGYCQEGQNAFGPFPEALVAKCRQVGGGEACRGARWNRDFLLGMIE